MKEIKAIIRPFKLIEVTEQLHEIEGLPGLTISEIHELGKVIPKTATDKKDNEMDNTIPMTKIEVVVNDNMADAVIDSIRKTAYTGNAGDGKIFVIKVEDVVKIRTNERGDMAI